MDAIFERLRVWRAAHELALGVYKATSKFPAAERYGLVSQLRRAATSIPTNIVEGNARHSRKEYLQFCHVARASLAELKYLLRLSYDLHLLPSETYQRLADGCVQVGKMLQGLINQLSKEGSDSGSRLPDPVPSQGVP